MLINTWNITGIGWRIHGGRISQRQTSSARFTPKQGQLVKQRTVQIVNKQNLMIRNIGVQLNGHQVSQLDKTKLAKRLPVRKQSLAAQNNLMH